MLTRLDVSDFDDTELGAEVRGAFAEGVTLVVLYDAAHPNLAAEGWPDGSRGLWRVRCERGHVWLSEKGVLTRLLTHRKCPTCGLHGMPIG